MNRKILLIDVDSKIPNLALMKLSAYYKSIGEDVSFNNTDEPDIVYASVIFKKNKHLVDGLRFYYPNSEIIIGGSGYDLTKRLPTVIENMMPDYDLYGDIEYSIGYSTRGCNRNCGFCIVPEKEGIFKRADHPILWHNSKFNKITFLDNNIFLDKEWFFEVSNFCIQNKLQVWFTQGLDIRLLDDDIAAQLKRMKFFKGVFFAWDDLKTESNVFKGLSTLSDNGFTKSDFRSLVNLYVYIDSDDEYDSGVYRCRKLKEFGVSPFVMFNLDSKRTTRIKHLQRWANRRQLLWGMDIDEYK